MKPVAPVPALPAAAEPPASEPRSTADFPLSGAAAQELARIRTASAGSASAVRATASAGRGLLRRYFAGRRTAVKDFLDGNERAVTGAVDRKRSAITAWFSARSAAMRGFVKGLADRAKAIGDTVGDAIKRGADVLVSAVTDTVSGVVAGIARFAHTIPIPDVPGIREVRDLVLGIADRIAGAVRTAMNHVRDFINQAVAIVVAAITGLVDLAGRVLMAVLDRFLAIVAHAVAWTTRQLADLALRIRRVLRSADSSSATVLRRLEADATGQVTRAEAGALADVAANRRFGEKSIEQVIEFCYANDDYPQDAATHGHLDVVDGTADRATFEGSTRAAMRAATAQVESGGAGILGGVRVAAARVAGAAAATANRFVAEVRGSVGRGWDTLTTRLGLVSTRIEGSVGGIVTRVSAGARGIVDRVGGGVTDARADALTAVSAPARALIGLAGRILDRAFGFIRDFVGGSVSGVVSRVTSLFTGGGRPERDHDTSSVTAGLDQFTPARVPGPAPAFAPAFAPAPAVPVVGGAIAIIIEALGAIAAVLLEVLAVILEILLAILIIIVVILLVVYLIYLLIKWVISLVRELVRYLWRRILRRRARRRRQRRKPLKWNPALAPPRIVIASGGVYGTLDTTAKMVGPAPLHGHHVWPRFVGGPDQQPLMSIRGFVHVSTVHPMMYPILQASAAAMGYRITNQTSRNQPFIRHLHNNINDRKIFAGVLTGFYGADLNAITQPRIPAPAYALGITSSFPRI